MGEVQSSHRCSHVRVGKDKARARCCRHCIIVVMCGGRKGVVGMQTCAMGMGISAGQQDHTHTRTHTIPIM